MNRLFRRSGLMVLSTLMLLTSCQEFDEPLYNDNTELSPILREIKDIPAITDGSLSLPDVGKSFGTDDDSRELTLSNGTFDIDWNSARLEETKKYQIVLIPLRLNTAVQFQHMTSVYGRTSKGMNKIFPFLLIKKSKDNGVLNASVMCYAPDRNYSKSHPYFAETISSKPTGKSDYSGFYIMSGLDGQLRYALRYRKGIKQFRVRPVKPSTRSSVSSKPGVKDNHIHSLFTLVIKAQTRSTGGHYGIEAGEGEWKCPFCHEIFEEDSYEFYNHECEEIVCEDDPGDDEDDEPDNEDIQEKEDDDNDSGNHGGGGGGGSGNGNGSSSNTNRHKSGEPYSYSKKDIRLKNQKFSGYMDSQSTSRSCFVCNIRNLCIIYDEYNTYKFSEMSEKSFIQHIANYDKSAIYDDGAVPTQYIPDIVGIWFNYEVWDNNGSKLNFIVDAINSEYPVLTYFPTLDDSNHLVYHNVIIIGYNPDYYYLVARDPNNGEVCYYNVNDLNYANYIIKIKNLK